MTTEPAINWTAWMQRWELQQEGYIPSREDRFEFMLSVLEAVAGEDFVVLDLACGPGAITRRVVQRFPMARVVAVDLDPVLLRIGSESLPDVGRNRVTWLEAVLNDPDWTRKLPVERFDAILTTTSLHWLSGGSLLSLYQSLPSLVREGGIFMNGDNMEYAPSQPTLRRVAQEVRGGYRERFVAGGGESWESWWTELRAEPVLEELFAERDRRFLWRNDESEKRTGAQVTAVHDFTEQRNQNKHTVGFDVHVAGLVDAGFREVGTVWQRLGNRVLAAVR